jgi:hypothetical protein
LKYVEEQVNVTLFLSLIKHHAMKTGGGVQVVLHGFVISALDGDEWSASLFSCFSNPPPLTPTGKRLVIFLE